MLILLDLHLFMRRNFQGYFLASKSRFVPKPIPNILSFQRHRSVPKYYAIRNWDIGNSLKKRNHYHLILLLQLILLLYHHYLLLLLLLLHLLHHLNLMGDFILNSRATLEAATRVIPRPASGCATKWTRSSGSLPWSGSAGKPRSGCSSRAPFPSLGASQRKTRTPTRTQPSGKEPTAPPARDSRRSGTRGIQTMRMPRRKMLKKKKIKKKKTFSPPKTPSGRSDPDKSFILWGIFNLSW